jgi:hypothetical protein
MGWKNSEEQKADEEKYESWLLEGEGYLLISLRDGAVELFWFENLCGSKL